MATLSKSPLSAASSSSSRKKSGNISRAQIKTTAAARERVRASKAVNAICMCVYEALSICLRGGPRELQPVADDRLVPKVKC